MKKYSVAVVGATGAVGEEIFRVLEELDFPVGDVLPLGSARSAGLEIEFKGNVNLIAATCSICGSRLFGDSKL